MKLQRCVTCNAVSVLVPDRWFDPSDCQLVRRVIVHNDEGYFRVCKGDLVPLPLSELTDA